MNCKCGEPALDGYKRCQGCIEAGRHYKERYSKKQDKLGLCPRCGRERKSGSRYCSVCLEASNKRHKIWRNNIYNKILDHYGRECVCCGEDNVGFLTLDHKNNDGAEQRKKWGHGGYLFYIKVIQMGYPDDLQILCYNCNVAKYRFGSCPHTEEGAKAVAEKYEEAS